MEKINNLTKARKFYDSKDYGKALEIFETQFSKNPGEFKPWDRILYSWSIYKVHIKESKDENELYDNVELVTELVPQADLNKKPTCPYTYSVLAIIKFLFNDGDYFNLEYWLDKIDPELLDENSNYNRPSRKEDFYKYASKTYLECGDFEECIEVSKEALSSIKSFRYNGDIWLKFRIAKALKELNKNHEAIDYLNDVVQVKKDWFVKRELAENYFALNDIENTLKYLCEAVLAEGSCYKKVNLYHFIYHVLEDVNPEIAFKHAEFVAALKRRRYSPIPEDLEELYIEVNALDKSELEREINDYWMNFKRNPENCLLNENYLKTIKMEE